MSEFHILLGLQSHKKEMVIIDQSLWSMVPVGNLLSYFLPLNKKIVKTLWDYRSLRLIINLCWKMVFGHCLSPSICTYALPLVTLYSTRF